MPSHVLTRHHLSDQISHQVKKPQISVSCRWLEARELSPEGIIEVNQSRGKPVPRSQRVAEQELSEGGVPEVSRRRLHGGVELEDQARISMMHMS